MDYDKAVTDGFIKVIGKEIDDAYIAELKKQNIHPEAITKVAKDIKIVYTPLHGTGNIPVRRVLAELGFENVYVVENRKSLTGIFQLLLIRILRTARLGRSHLNLQKKKMQTLFLRQTLMQTDLVFMLRTKRQANM